MLRVNGYQKPSWDDSGSAVLIFSKRVLKKTFGWEKKGKEIIISPIHDH